MLILTKFNKNLILKINKLFYYLTNKVTKILTLIIKLNEKAQKLILLSFENCKNLKNSGDS